MHGTLWYILNLWCWQEVLWEFAVLKRKWSQESLILVVEIQSYGQIFSHVRLYSIINQVGERGLMGEGGWIEKFFERFSSLLICGSTFQSMNFKIGLLCLAPLLGDQTVKQENLFNITMYWTEVHFTSSQLLWTCCRKKLQTSLCFLRIHSNSLLQIFWCWLSEMKEESRNIVEIRDESKQRVNT